MKKEARVLIITFISLFLVVQISATTPTLSYENRLNFGHVLIIRNISTNPDFLVPGEPATLKMSVENTGNQFVNDIVITFNSTDKIFLMNDISQVKIPRLESGEFEDISFDIIALPSAAEGVDNPKITIDYVNHIGEEREDVGEIGLAIKGVPGIFAKIESTGIYKGNDLGSVTIKFVNNGLGDAKYLTVQMQESKIMILYQVIQNILGIWIKMIFESVDFKIKLNKEKDTTLLLNINYKDSLNEDYSKEFNLPLKLRSADELGIKTNGTSTIIVVIIIIALIAYFVYRKYKKKKKIITI